MGQEVTEQSDVYSLGIVPLRDAHRRRPVQGREPVAVAMKHVREPLPDVQRRAPEVSAALAAVVERATAKELRNRYATMARWCTTSSRRWPIEAARAAKATGEATTVLRALPAGTPAPWRCASPRRATRADARRRRGRGGRADRRRHRPLAAATAGARRPQGAGRDRRCRWRPPRSTTTTPSATATRPSITPTRSAIDGNPTTAWATETLQRRPRGQQARRRPLRRRRPPGRGATAST